MGSDPRGKRFAGLSVKQLKMAAVVVSIVAGVTTVFVAFRDEPGSGSPASRDDNTVTVNGDRNNTVVGTGNTLVVDREKPGYRIALQGDRVMKAGGTLALFADADQPRFLDGITCRWSVDRHPEIELELTERGCRLMVAVRKVPSTLTMRTVNVALSITQDDQHYSVRDEFHVTPDHDSDAFREDMLARSRERIDQTFQDAQRTLDGIVPQVEALQKRGYGLKEELLRKTLPLKLTNPRNRLVRCSATGCEIDQRDLCDAGVNELLLGAQPGKWLTRHALDCAKASRDGEDACLHSGLDMFGMVPGMTLHGEARFAGSDDGVAFAQTLPERIDHYDQRRNWVALPGSRPDDEHPPFAAMLVDVARQQFRLYVATGKCEYQHTDLGYTYDVDGKGFVAAAKGQNPFDILMPNRDEIAVGITRDGTRHGPFHYRFDRRAIISELAARLPEPQLRCNRLRDKRVCRIPAQDAALPWARISRLRYGANADALKAKLPIAVPGRQVFGRISDSDLAEIQIEVPASWSSFYYSFDYVDGNSAPVLRVPL